MALTNENDSTFPPSGLAPYRIDRAWCLGDSLPYLNANFRNFDTRIDANTTALAAASATLNTTIASTSSTLNTKVDTLSTNIQQSPYAAKAWVNFDGTTTPPTIRNSYNVTSVTRTSTGVYRVDLSVTMPAAYAVVGSSSGAPGYNDITTQTTPTNTAYFNIATTGHLGSTQAAANASNISAIIFG